MKERLKEALRNMQRYNAGVMSRECFGFDPEIEYDALVVAPGWKPDKTISDPSFTVTKLALHAYFSGFLVEKDGLRIAWAQTASGACNVLDHILVCAELRFNRFVFAGAAGGLVPMFDVGDVCTPDVCLQGSYAGAYLQEKLSAFTPFGPICPPDRDYVDRIVALGWKLGHEIRRAKVFARTPSPSNTPTWTRSKPPARSSSRWRRPPSMRWRICSRCPPWRFWRFRTTPPSARRCWGGKRWARPMEKPAAGPFQT